MSEEIKVTRVERDDKGIRTRYEDIEVGMELGEIEWEITSEMVAKQMSVDEDYSLWYVSDETPFEGRICPPQITYRPPRWLISRHYNIRGVFYRWEFENRAPIKPDSVIKITGRVTNKWIKNNREYVEYEAEGKDEVGNVLFQTKRVHVLDVIERNAPREGTGVDSGVKKESL